MLLCYALRCERSYLYAHGLDELPTNGWIHYGRYLNERLKGKPTQYITKQQEFYGRNFRVTPDVLIPRPETEHLVEAAIAAIRTGGYQRIFDVGTGSGAIAVSIALELNHRVYACDISAAALECGRAEQGCVSRGRHVLRRRPCLRHCAANARSARIQPPLYSRKRCR